MQDILTTSAYFFLGYWIGYSLAFIVQEVQDKMARIYHPDLNEVLSPHFKLILGESSYAKAKAIDDWFFESHL
jgi:hypothetical protein